LSSTWNPDDEPQPVQFGIAGWIRVVGKGIVLISVLLSGLVLMLLIRLIERPLFGLRRPVTPFITQGVCRIAFVVFGMRFETQGRPMRRPGAVVANHGSWLDIFSLNARKRIYFVSKSEVANWPGIGILAKAVGTVFITRDPKQAKEQKALFEGRLLAGHKLLFFPEGTSTDGKRILPFKPTLFQAFFSDDLRHEMHIQPVTVIYRAPKGQDPRFYGWWGDMSFGSHLIKLLATSPHGSVMVLYHEPVRVDAFADRKALARHAESVVRSGMQSQEGSSEL